MNESGVDGTSWLSFGGATLVQGLELRGIKKKLALTFVGHIPNN
jgi:hypothetical protein